MPTHRCGQAPADGQQSTCRLTEAVCPHSMPLSRAGSLDPEEAAHVRCSVRRARRGRARCADLPDVERVVDINALRALAPPSLPPVPRPSGPQARMPQPRWSRRHNTEWPDGHIYIEEKPMIPGPSTAGPVGPKAKTRVPVYVSQLVPLDTTSLSPHHKHSMNHGRHRSTCPFAHQYQSESHRGFVLQGAAPNLFQTYRDVAGRVNWERD